MTFRHFGMPEWDLATTKASVDKSLRDSFPSMFGDRWTEARDVFSHSFETIHLDYLRPFPGAAEMLAALADRGLYLGVVSNKRGGFLRKEAEILGWNSLFGALVGANDATADKPAVDPVHLALKNSGINAGPEVLFVGDMPIDMHCAINSGCVPVLMRDLPPRPGEFDAHPPVYCLSDCLSLSALVHELSVPISPI